MKKAFSIIAAALFALVACSSVKEIDRDRNLGGYNMKATRLIVADDFSFQSQSSKLTLLAGEYQPALVDSEGVYFSSPKGVLVDNSLRKGGVYLENGTGRPTHVWVSSVFISKVAALPREFKFEMVHH